MLVFRHDADRARIALRPIALTVVGNLAHRHFPLFQITMLLSSRAMFHGTSGGRLVRQSMLERVQPTRAAEKVAVERHVRGQALFHQQMTARGQVVFLTPGLDLPEEVL